MDLIAEKPPETRRQLAFTQFLGWGFWLASAVPLGVLIYLGAFARYFADDYSTASIVRSLGFWPAQVYWYQNWTGSYTYTFLTSFLELFGVAVVPWLQALCLLAWIGLVFWGLALLFKILEMEVGRLWLAALANVIVFVTTLTFRDYTQVLFWQTGIVAYLSNSLIFAATLVYFAGRLIDRRERPVSVSVCVALFVVFAISGGICETWIIMQLALFCLGLALSLLYPRSAARDNFLRMFAVGLLASLVAFVITFRAPGNANHAKNIFVFSVASVSQALLTSLADMARFLFEWVQGRTLLVALLFVASLLVGTLAVSARAQLARQARSVVYIFLGAVCLLWMGFFPGFFVFGVRPPDRALFTGMYIFVLGVSLVGVWVGSLLKQLTRPAVAGLIRIFLAIGLGALLVFSPLRTASALWGLLPSFERYAQLWQQRDQKLRQAQLDGEQNVVVPAFRNHPDLREIQKTIWIVGDLELAPNHWINQAAAVYYGLHSIATVRK